MSKRLYRGQRSTRRILERYVGHHSSRQRARVHLRGPDVCLGVEVDSYRSIRSSCSYQSSRSSDLLQTNESHSAGVRTNSPLKSVTQERPR